jgi:hypothetical protein
MTQEGTRVRPNTASETVADENVQERDGKQSWPKRNS